MPIIFLHVLLLHTQNRQQQADIVCPRIRNAAQRQPSLERFFHRLLRVEAEYLIRKNGFIAHPTQCPSVFARC
jgi:hypothetical protein